MYLGCYIFVLLYF